LELVKSQNDWREKVEKKAGARILQSQRFAFSFAGNREEGMQENGLVLSTYSMQKKGVSLNECALCIGCYERIEIFKIALNKFLDMKEKRETKKDLFK